MQPTTYVIDQTKAIEQLTRKMTHLRAGPQKGAKNAGRPRKYPKDVFAPSIWEHGKATICVLRRHIEDAMLANSSHCAIAMAIAEAVPDARYIAVDLQTIRWTDPKKKVRYCFLTPSIAQHQIIIPFDQGERDKCVETTFRMKPAFVTRSGPRRTHTPDPEQLKDAKLRVAKEQLHIPASESFHPLDKDPPPHIPAPSAANETNATPAHESRLADLMKADAPVIEKRESDLDKAEMKSEPPPPRKPRVARVKISATKPDGTIPTTLGGRLPPLSVLARREFGLRALKR
jgi:hypothetical protein